MSTIQHVEARKLLAIISSAVTTHRLLTYGSAAKALGRNPANNSRMVAQVCDLLDAAATLAGTPLLALVMVRELSGDINRKAWAGEDSKPGRREAIISNSLAHQFTIEDFKSISEALDRLDGKSNRAAWKFVRETIPPETMYRNLEGEGSVPSQDAIDDIGSDRPARSESTTFKYARDPKIREAVMRRAGGKCELCGAAGFICDNGDRYLESHHIIALAAEGVDRMTNVIALCPGDHREAHFGKRRAELEKRMILKIVAIENRNVAC
jgi:5-methylcytosine-specific restriction endonuclease McrA